jgi:cysteine desulfurase
VLTAMGLSPLRAGSSLRFSLSRLTTQDEVTDAAAYIAAAVNAVRGAHLTPSHERLVRSS